MRGRELPTLWRPLPLLGLWLAAGIALSSLTGRVRDWFDMTDELRYERLAISIAESHSLVPRIHGVDIQSFSQLYPLLIAPLFAHGLVPHDLADAHVFDAWVMSSACVPAYLLARRVTGVRRYAYLVAALSVCMPWILYSAMLMTEVAAYPAFCWALLALVAATERPSPARDLLALAGLALAFFARTELLVLVPVLPVAIVCFEAGRAAEGRGLGARGRRGLGAAARGHPLLVGAYGLLGAGAIALAIAGRLAGVVGVYGVYAGQSTLVPPGLAGSFAAHAALLALGLGIVPFLAAVAWMLAAALRPEGRGERDAFACVASASLLALLLQATDFDVRYTGYVHDRFLLYLVPPLLLGMCCALQSTRRLRLALLAPTIVVACGFAFGSFPAFTWQQFATLTPDSPMSGILRRVVSLTGGLGAARGALAALTVLGALALALAATRLPRGRVALALCAFAAAALCATTFLTFNQFFGTDGWAYRPLTRPEAGVFDWIDGDVGPRGRVTAIPYLTSSSYLISEILWRDVEFWNRSVVRDALYAPEGGDAYAYTGIWFPKLALRFDPATGLANLSPTPWVAVSDKDTRFALAGSAREDVPAQDLLLVRADEPWRAAWISYGLYDDGWTRPGVTARIRVYPYPGQRTARVRTFAFAAHAPQEVASQPLRIVTDMAHWSGEATDTGSVTGTIALCVPPRSYAVISLSTPVSSVIPGDQATEATSTGARRGGVFFGETALSSQIGGRCRA